MNYRAALLSCCLIFIDGPFAAAQTAPAQPVDGLYMCTFATSNLSGDVRVHLLTAGAVESAHARIRNRGRVCLYPVMSRGNYTASGSDVDVVLDMAGGGGGWQRLCPMDLYQQSIYLSIRSGPGASTIQTRVGQAAGNCTHPGGQVNSGGQVNAPGSPTPRGSGS